MDPMGMDVPDDVPMLFTGFFDNRWTTRYHGLGHQLPIRNPQEESPTGGYPVG